MTDFDDLPFDYEEAAGPTLAGAAPRKHRHQWQATAWTVGRPAGKPPILVCRRCGVIRDETRARRGKQSRNYGNRAELKVARTYGGQKVGHAGGPVDVRGKDFNTQVKTHRRPPPAEWRKVFAALEASGDRLPRLLLRFVQAGVQPQDYFVIPAKAWLDWYGRDE
jgi:hypothetical protein